MTSSSAISDCPKISGSQRNTDMAGPVKMKGGLHGGPCAGMLATAGCCLNMLSAKGSKDLCKYGACMVDHGFPCLRLGHLDS